MTGSIERRRELPSADYLRTILAYKDGKLFWRSRPVASFASTRIANVWNGTWAGKRAGSPMRNGYRMVSIDGTKFLEHRLIHHMVKGPVRAEDTVDHEDHDHTNNREENLRLCTQAKNAMNQPGRRGDAIPRHVYWSKRERKYKVSMRADGRQHFIGTYGSLSEASTAAEEARARLHGSFAYQGGSR